MLGLDPLQVANEGKLLAVVPKDSADQVVTAMRQHPLGKKAAIIGEVIESPKGMVLGKTVIGSERVIDMPAGELLPRIC
jgi:hydrogenase expression/formation protein HypE